LVLDLVETMATNDMQATVAHEVEPVEVDRRGLCACDNYFSDEHDAAGSVAGKRKTKTPPGGANRPTAHQGR
jgi:hypothetical protein